MLTTGRLNGYAISMGFVSERERLEMFLTALDKDPVAAEAWLDSGGKKPELLAILKAKRRLRLEREGDE